MQLLTSQAVTSNHETLQRAYEKLRDEYTRKNRQYQKAEAQLKHVCHQTGYNEAARNGQEQSERLVNHATTYPVAPNHAASRAFAHLPGFTSAHPTEQLHSRQRSGGSRNENSPGTGNPQLQPLRGSQTWVGNCESRMDGATSVHVYPSIVGIHNPAIRLTGQCFSAQYTDAK